MHIRRHLKSDFRRDKKQKWNHDATADGQVVGQTYLHAIGKDIGILEIFFSFFKGYGGRSEKIARRMWIRKNVGISLDLIFLYALNPFDLASGNIE